MSLGRVAARLIFPLAERVEGRSIRPKLARLHAEATDPFEVRRQRQARRLASIVQFAGRHVPFYRERFAEHGFDPRALDSDLGSIEALPPLDRDTLVEAGPRLLDERLDASRLHARRTGGSTGASAVIHYSKAALDWTAAVNFFVRDWASKTPFEREAHLSTSPGIDIPVRDRAREWVKCASLNRTNLPIAGWDAETLESLRRRLARRHPSLVQGHPSTLHALAHHVRETGGLSGPLFGVFESTGETLDAGVRKTIEENLGCSIVDRYGSAEFGVVAYERPGGRAGMEILEGVVFAETLPDEEGREELVLTGLLNQAMPLLRYRTGDLVRLAREPDEVAGRIVEIQGRVHDALELDGLRVPTHVVQDRLDRFDCIEEFQVEVGDDGPPRLRIAAPDAEHARIRSGIAEWWGGAFDLEFAKREHFVRTGWRGKFHHLVRNDGDTKPKGDA